MENINDLVGTYFDESITTLDKHNDRLELLKNCKRPTINSIWKPKEKFHIGHYACLLNLVNFVRLGSEVEIIIAQDKDDELNIELKIAATKAFITNMANGNIKDIPIRLLQNPEQNYQSEIPLFFNGFLGKYSNNEMIKRFLIRDWNRNPNFIYNLFGSLIENCINSRDYVFLVSGKKHLDTWETIKWFLDENQNIKNFFPIYLKDILDVNINSMSSKTPDKIFISFDLSSKFEINRISKRIINLSPIDQNTENKEVYERIINQIILPSEERVEGKMYSELREYQDKVDYLTDFILGKINKWIHIKNGIINNVNRVEINNTFLLEFLKKEFELYINDLSFNDKVNIDINPENYREYYQKLVQQTYTCITKNSAELKLINPLQGLIQNSSNIDIISYLMEKWHRDHYLHQFNVAALGEFFLSVYSSKEETLLEEIVKKKKLDKTQVRYAWWTASLLHDHAYPIEKLINLLEKLKNLENIYEIENFSIEIFNAMKSTSILSNYFESFFTKCIEYRGSRLDQVFADLDSFSNKVYRALNIKTEFNHLGHGHLGVINICSKIGIQENDSVENIRKKIPLWLVQSLTAISMHHESVKNEKICFANEPITFLLILSDELQEWTRRQIERKNGEEQFTHSISKTILDLNSVAEKYSYLENLSICFVCSDQTELKNIGWDYHRFFDDKKKSLNRLDFIKDRAENYPRSINYSININGS